MVRNRSCDNPPVPFVCRTCHDWWRVVQSGDKYHLRVGFDYFSRPMTDPPTVKLSFRMIVNGIKEAYDWNIENHRQSGAAEVVQNFLQALCLKDFDKGEMYKAIRARKSFDEVLATNPVLKQYLELCIELDMYPSIPMHMFFLGVQKSLLVEGKNLKWIDNRLTRQWLINLRNTMLESQRELNKLSLDWCRVMAFKSKDKWNLGQGIGSPGTIPHSLGCRYFNSLLWTRLLKALRYHMICEMLSLHTEK